MTSENHSADGLAPAAQGQGNIAACV